MPDAGRVITGTAGGLRLEAPGPATRPLSDKVKQSLFSILESESPGLWSGPALDLYAGSGSGGIEALSRGAPAAVFVERDRAAAHTIVANLERTRLVDLARIVRGDVLDLLAGGIAACPEAPFDSVLLDPPYARADELYAALRWLGDAGVGWVTPSGVVAAKHFWKDGPEERIGDLLRVRQRRFGETALSVYRRDPHPVPGEDR